MYKSPKNLYETHAIEHSHTTNTNIHSISKSNQRHKFYEREARVKPYKWEHVWARAHTQAHTRARTMTLPHIAHNNELSRSWKSASMARMGAINFNSSAWTPYFRLVCWLAGWLFFTVLVHLLPLISELYTCVLVVCMTVCKIVKYFSIHSDSNSD